MPTYEYICKNCGHQFEQVRSIREHDEKPKPPCPKCGSKKVEQAISSFSAITSKKS